MGYRPFPPFPRRLAGLAVAFLLAPWALGAQAPAPAAQPEEAFLNAASPGVVAVFLENRHYPSHQAYLEALAAVLKTEYEAIVNAGRQRLILHGLTAEQVDGITHEEGGEVLAEFYLPR